MVLIGIVGILFATAILSETLGVWFRFAGALHGSPALGYSTHVRVATLGRFFILLSAPMMGFMIDTGAGKTAVAAIGSVSMFFVFITLLLFFSLNRLGLILRIYSFMNRALDISDVDYQPIQKKLSFGDLRFFLASSFSFILTASGVVVVNYVAAIAPENRAMIVQMSAIVTMAGTLVHAFYIDPVLAKACDDDCDIAYASIRDFLYGRCLGSVLLLLLFIGLYFYE